jgi:glutamine amidotransferase
VQHIRARGLEQPIKEAIASGKPFLGICLGLQILLNQVKKANYQDWELSKEKYDGLFTNPELLFPTWVGINCN